MSNGTAAKSAHRYMHVHIRVDVDNDTYGIYVERERGGENVYMYVYICIYTRTHYLCKTEDILRSLRTLTSVLFPKVLCMIYVDPVTYQHHGTMSQNPSRCYC